MGANSRGSNRAEGSRWGGQDREAQGDSEGHELSVGGEGRGERRQGPQVRDPDRAALFVDWIGDDYTNVV